MRWYRLTEEERRILHAPAEIDGLGILVLTLFDRWQRDAVFVLVRAFVDESGTEEPRVMLAALVARAHHWHGFNAKWAKLLKKENVDHFHLVAMENKRAPFKDWGKPRTALFVSQTPRMLKHYCDFGTTVALSKSDHKVHYLPNLSKRSRKESAYGVCSRILIESVVCEAMEAFGYDTVVNFIFEDSQHFDSARCAFNDLKEHVPAIAPNLGTIVPGAKKDFPGLQAADAIVSLGRRSEPTAEFITFQSGTCRVPRDHGRMPIFHVFIDERRLAAACLQADDIAGEKKMRKKKGG